MVDFFLFYVFVSIVGWLTFPLAYRLLHRLPDRGYMVSRPLGMLLWGYIFWMLASLHVIKNDLGGVILSLVLLAILNVWLCRGQIWREMRAWILSRKKVILTGEALFLLAFASWAIVRAMNPDIAGTEKPMELAFINAILRSDYFPPHDPWLSGYAISYYYFGYVMVAMLVRLTGISSGVGFNLGIACWFAMTALAAYGIIFSLVYLVRNRLKKNEGDGYAAGWGLLGPLYILIVSNIEGFLEMLHARGLFWVKAENGVLTSSFWSWLNINELTHPPTLPLSWLPERLGGIWWWRASRVLQDFDMQGQVKEIIDEFPYFSYLLADLHPHVLAMPFVLLSIALALNFYLKGGRKRAEEGLSLRTWFNLWYRDGLYQGFKKLDIYQWLHRTDFWLAALVLGGLAFLTPGIFPFM